MFSELHDDKTVTAGAALGAGAPTGGAVGAAPSPAAAVAWRTDAGDIAGRAATAAGATAIAAAGRGDDAVGSDGSCEVHITADPVAATAAGGGGGAGATAAALAAR